MNRYETAVIFDTEWQEEERNSFITRLDGIIEKFSGQIVDREEWENRKLAYRIQKKLRGDYYFLRYSGERGVVEELERILGLNENVLRFLTTIYEKDIKGKFPLPPSIDDMLQRDIIELQALKSQWRRGVGRAREEEAVKPAEPVKKEETADAAEPAKEEVPEKAAEPAKEEEPERASEPAKEEEPEEAAEPANEEEPEEAAEPAKEEEPVSTSPSEEAEEGVDKDESLKKSE
jgi:small subunit ribosomal protein S6